MKKLVGIAILIVAVAVAVIFSLNKGDKTSAPGATQTPVKKADPIVVTGYTGSSKINYFNNPAVQKILLDKYNIVVKAEKASSIGMIDKPLDKIDYLFPGSAYSLDYFQAKYADKSSKSEYLFNTPVVLLTWDKVVPALTKNGIVVERSGVNYIPDLSKMMDLVSKGKKWSDIGLTELAGNVTVFASDPSKSDPSVSFGTLLATMYNNGEVITTSEQASKVKPMVNKFFDQIGRLEGSSTDLLKQFFNEGYGSMPIMVCNESQILDYAIANPEDWVVLKDKVKILYPEPTIWAAHPFISISKNGNALLEALKDRELTAIAWKSHGFRARSGLQTESLQSGMPQEITKVIKSPKYDIMKVLFDTLN